MLPLPFLSHLSNPNVRLVIITGFTFLFASMFSVLTKSKTSEIFMAMAAYVLPAINKWWWWRKDLANGYIGMLHF